MKYYQNLISSGGERIIKTPNLFALVSIIVSLGWLIIFYLVTEARGEIVTQEMWAGRGDDFSIDIPGNWAYQLFTSSEVRATR